MYRLGDDFKCRKINLGLLFSYENFNPTVLSLKNTCFIKYVTTWVILCMYLICIFFSVLYLGGKK
jgi:hypothetical protein